MSAADGTGWSEGAARAAQRQPPPQPNLGRNDDENVTPHSVNSSTVTDDGEPNIDADAVFFGDEDVIGQILQDDDYYARLNVNKSSSDEEITNAYRRLARILHPDKHVVRSDNSADSSAALKTVAEKAFNRIREAHEVLSDPVRRAIYDACGLEGLRVAGLQIEPFSREQLSSSNGAKNADEIRSMFTKLRAEKKEQRMIEQTTPHHEVTVSLDASDMFDPKAPVVDSASLPLSLPNLEITFMQSTQLISAQWPPVDRLQFFSTIQYEKGSGNGIIGFEISRPLFNNQVTGEMKVLTGPGKGLVNHFKLSKRWGSKRSVSCGLFTALTGYGFSRPVLEASIHQSLSDQLSGRLSLRQAGRQSTVSTRLDYETEKYGSFSTNVDVGFRHTSLTLGWRYTFAGIHEQRVHARVTISDRGDYGIEYGLRRRITKITKLGGTVDISSRTGVRLRLNIQRFSQVYNVPILLAHDATNYGAIFYATVVPLAVVYITTSDYVMPKWRALFISKVRTQFEARRSQVEQRRREAIEYRQLMRNRYDDIVDSEGRQGGLVITHALYGPEAAIARLMREQRVPLISPLLMTAAAPDQSSTSFAYLQQQQQQPASAYSRDAPMSNLLNGLTSSSSFAAWTSGSADERSFLASLEHVLDVTVAVQCLVNTKTQSLQLTSQGKSDVPGFCDCAVGEKKTLLINYLWHGKTNVVVVDDYGTVQLPSSAHQV